MLKQRRPLKLLSAGIFGLVIMLMLATAPFFNLAATTTASQDCTYTIGYWKTHPTAWPVSSLALGGVTYNKTQLLNILNTQPKGDATYILAHQLIAAKLNTAQGATPTALGSTISQADSWLVANPLGSKPRNGTVGTALSTVLDAFNNGLIGPGHCSESVPTTPPPTPTPVPVCYDYNAMEVPCP